MFKLETGINGLRKKRSKGTLFSPNASWTDRRNTHTRPPEYTSDRPRYGISHRLPKGTHQKTLQPRTVDCTFYEKVSPRPKIKTKYRRLKTQEGKLNASQNYSQTSLKKKQVIRQNSSAKHCDTVRKTASSQLSLSALTASVSAWQRLSVYTVNIKITYNGYTSPSICQRSLRIEHFASVPPLIQRHANLLTVTQHQEVWILLIEGCRTCFVRTWWLLAQG